MTDKEMRELDSWIAVKVMGWTDDVAGSGHFFDFKPTPPRTIDYHDWQPTTDPAAAMAVLEKCASKTSLAINEGTVGFFWVGDLDKKSRYSIAGTLPLAICLFAKELFGKDSK